MIEMLRIDTFDRAKLRLLNQGKKSRSVSTLSTPRASDRGVEWVDSNSFLENVTIEELAPLEANSITLISLDITYVFMYVKY